MGRYARDLVVLELSYLYAELLPEPLRVSANHALRWRGSSRRLGTALPGRT